jgi:ankyrin repeat protein
VIFENYRGRSGGGVQELHDAAWRGDLDGVRRLLAAGADPNVPESDEVDFGWSPLMLAARSPVIMRLLLDAGADPCFATEEGESVVMAVARIGSSEGLRMLRAAGADFRQVDRNGDNALMEAASAGNQETVEFLLGQGLAVDDTTNNGGTALMAAAISGEPDMVGLLLAAGADRNRSIRSGAHTGKTALDFAVEHDHAAIVALLAPAA